MDKQLQNDFLRKWDKYFTGAQLPIAYFYVDQASESDIQDSKNEHRCLICNLNHAREGQSFVYGSESPGCLGGKRYTGYSQTLRPHFEYFLSCGLPGKVEGERYKKSPELVQEYLKNNPPFAAPARHLVFKRWDKLGEQDNPTAVIFFATADVLSGLFTLANFDRADSDGVICPMGSGCSSIIAHPLSESKADSPRCVLGMFDVSARPCVPKDTLSFTVPMGRFIHMFQNMDESFLITKTWDAVKKRVAH